MDLPRYAAMSRYWDSHPPLHLMVQGYLGIEAKPAKAQQIDSEADFIASFASCGGMVN